MINGWVRATNVRGEPVFLNLRTATFMTLTSRGTRVYWADNHAKEVQETPEQLIRRMTQNDQGD
mgnify:CR=1 FL=1